MSTPHYIYIIHKYSTYNIIYNIYKNNTNFRHKSKKHTQAPVPTSEGKMAVK